MTNDNNGNNDNDNESILVKLNKLMNGIPKVESMESYNGNAVPNQFVISGTEWEMFQSYHSRIAVVWQGQVYLFRDWDYSRTTLKYLKQFLGYSKPEISAKLKSGEYTAVDFEVC
jgi:hypothetical protein